jgi:hypothetical protein
MCDRTNATYLDCPVSNYDLEEGSEFFVSVHNPSSIKLNVAQISVPHGNFKVQEYSASEKGYKEAQGVDVMCYRDYNAQGAEMQNCQMFIKSSIEPRDIILFKLTVDKSLNNEVPQEALKSGDFVENKNLKLQFNQGNTKESSLNFSILDKEFNSENVFEFLMRYWPSYCNNSPSGNGHNSGAYDFRPIDYLFESLTYSELTEAKIQKGSFMSKMIFYFEKFDKKSQSIGMKAIVHVTVDQDLDVIKFDVDLNSLPKLYTDGYEFVATFDAKDFNNNQTFYTDSNGLEMQKRVLNYRSFYNFTEQWADPTFPLHNQNISGNYYPVTSAISLKDGSRQFTLSNDRS